VSAHFRTRLLRCSNWQTTVWSRDGMLWKRVAKVEQRPINTRWFSAKRQRHCVGARRIRPKCIVRVCPAVEVTVGFIPCYYNRIMKDKIWQSYSKKTKRWHFFGDTVYIKRHLYTVYTCLHLYNRFNCFTQFQVPIMQCYKLSTNYANIYDSCKITTEQSAESWYSCMLLNKVELGRVH